jgi:hypothetical protein
MKYSHQKYTYTPGFGDWVHHSYEIHCAQGAVAFNVQIHTKNEYSPSCGLEFHSRTPTYDNAPSHVKCNVLNAPCWHDGTSSYAHTLWEEHGWERCCQNGNHDAIFRQMETEAYSHWKDDKDDD